MLCGLSVPMVWRKIKPFEAVKCGVCGKIIYPKRKTCPDCLSNDLSDFKLSGKGEIVSFTTIHTASSRFEKNIPYIMAVIKLEEGPRIISQIISDKTNVEIGKKVCCVPRIISKDKKNGLILYGYKFEVIE